MFGVVRSQKITKEGLDAVGESVRCGGIQDSQKLSWFEALV